MISYCFHVTNTLGLLLKIKFSLSKALHVPINFVLEPGLPCIVNMEAITVFGPKLGPNLSIRCQTNLFPACKRSYFPLTPNPRKLANLVPLKATSNTLVCEDEENNRKFIKLAPSEWRHHFLSTHVDFSVSLSIKYFIYVYNMESCMLTFLCF